MNHYDPYEIIWISEKYLSKDKKNYYITISIKNLKSGVTKNTYVVPERVATGRPFNNYKNWKSIVDNADSAKKLVWHFEQYMIANGEQHKWGPDRSGNINADSIIFSYGDKVADYKNKNKSVKEDEQVTFENDLFEMK